MTSAELERLLDALTQCCISYDDGRRMAQQILSAWGEMERELIRLRERCASPWGDTERVNDLRAQLASAKAEVERLRSSRDEWMYDTANLRAENERLVGLLRECRPVILNLLNEVKGLPESSGWAEVLNAIDAALEGK